MTTVTCFLLIHEFSVFDLFIIFSQRFSRQLLQRLLFFTELTRKVPLFSTDFIQLGGKQRSRVRFTASAKNYRAFTEPEETEGCAALKSCIF